MGTELEQAQIDDRARADTEPRVQAEQIAPHCRQALDGAMRTLERCQRDDVMSERAAVAMERVVRHQDPVGLTARYLTAVADPAYNSAFGKLLQYADTAAMRMTADEQAAVQRVSAIEAERAMVDATGASGGFGLPIAIDPTILLTSAGALNPIRELADVRQISTYTPRLVSAATPAANYGAEMTEVADGTPTLVQPTVTTAKGMEFIPFSIEIGEDWTGLQQDLLKLLTDGQAILDATMFLAGTGSNQPQGLFSGAGGLQTTSRTQTATTATSVSGDLHRGSTGHQLDAVLEERDIRREPHGVGHLLPLRRSGEHDRPAALHAGARRFVLGDAEGRVVDQERGHRGHGQQDRHRRRLVRLCDRRSRRRFG